MARRSVSRQTPRGKSETRATPAKQTRMKRFTPHLPYEDFPLFPHQSGRWAKKIRQRLQYFGSLNDRWQVALDEYLRTKDFLQAGRSAPAAESDAITVADVCNQFLRSKRDKVECGELSQRSLDDYTATTDKIVEAFGKARLVEELDPEDFRKLRARLAKGRSPGTLKNEINRVRCTFKYAFTNQLIDRPVRYGSNFDRPSQKVLRNDKAGRPAKELAAEEIRLLLDEASPQIRAMILLGVNVGYGNSDVSRLNRSDIRGNVIDLVRVKTGAPRRCLLWDETLEAIEDVTDLREEPADVADADAVFLTRGGNRYCAEKNKNFLSQEFTKLARRVGVYRAGVSFYALRHTFRTHAGETGDIEAVDRLMGHEPGRGSAAVHYIERINDQRLKRVTDHVHDWLFNSQSFDDHYRDGVIRKIG